MRGSRPLVRAARRCAAADLSAGERASRAPLVGVLIGTLYSGTAAQRGRQFLNHAQVTDWLLLTKYCAASWQEVPERGEKHDETVRWRSGAQSAEGAYLSCGKGHRDREGAGRP